MIRSLTTVKITKTGRVWTRLIWQLFSKKQICLIWFSNVDYRFFLQILIKFTSLEILEIRLPRSLESSVDAYGYENFNFIFKLNLKIRKTMVKLYRCLSWARCSPSKSAQETKRRFPQSCGRIIFTNTDSQSSKFYSLISLHNL